MIANLITLILVSPPLQLALANPAPVEAPETADSEFGTTIPLRRSKHDLQQSSRALRKRAANVNFAQQDADAVAAAPQAGYALLRSTGASFLAPIELGSQTFIAIVDTGSADTWVASSAVQCLDLVTGQKIPQRKCAFGPLYNSGKGEFKQIPNQNFNITYGDDEFLTGPVGTLDIALSGIRVPNQTVSIVDQAAWLGDGLTSGLIGLAYPALTAAFPGTDPTRDRYCSPGLSADQCNQIEYSSLTDNMFFRQKVARPVFALALSRDESGTGDGGYLTIGGIPKLSQVGVKSNTFASTKIKILPFDDRLRYYLIGVEGLVMLPAGTPVPADGVTTTSRMSSMMTRTRTSRPTSTRGGGRPGNNAPWWQGGWGNNGNGRRPQMQAREDRCDNAAERPTPPTPSGNMQNDVTDYVVDSGTTLSFLPAADAAKFNSMFNPPATLDRYSAFYMIPCNAQVPPLGVKIGGTVFWHNPKDLVKRFDSFGQQCVSGIQSSGRMGINILGDVFLDSVLVVFDLNQHAIKFAARREYQS